MIIVVVIQEKDESGISRTVVSHGYDLETDHPIVLPPVSPAEIGAHFSKALEEWVID